MQSPNYHTKAYTKEELKLSLLDYFKDNKNKTKLEIIIDDVLEKFKSSYNNCSKRAYINSSDNIIKKEIENAYKKNDSYQHSKYHYTNYI